MYIKYIQYIPYLYKYYQDHDRLKNKQSVQRQIKDDQERKMHRFRPELNIDNSITNSFHERLVAVRLLLKLHLLIILKQYKTSKSIHKDKILNQVERQLQDECTFSPKICSGSKDIKIEAPAHVRLYE